MITLDESVLRSAAVWCRELLDGGETAEELGSRGFDDVLGSKASESLQFCKSTLVGRICADDASVVGEELRSAESAREGLGVLVELVGGQGLGQHVRHVVVSVDVAERDGAVLDVLMYEVETERQVSRAPGELVLGRKGDGCEDIHNEIYPEELDNCERT